MSQDKKSAAKKTDLTGKIWQFFTSLRLVIFLLLIIALLSVFGTVIEQNKPLHEYYMYFQPETVELFQRLGLLDMYHSWWFISCLALLAISIIVCTVDRYPGIIAHMRGKNLVLDETLAKALHPLEKIEYALPVEDVEQKVLALTAKNFAGHSTVSQEGNARHLFFEKGKYSRLAFFLTHLSILLIFLGAIVGLLAGYKGNMMIFEQDAASSVETRSGNVKDLDFTVKCNSFNIDFYPNGMPKVYRSDLSIIDEGREVARKTIRVNDPLTYKGITLYQSSYGVLPVEAHLKIIDKKGALRGEIAAPFGEMVNVPGSTDKIEIADYQEHFPLHGGSDGGPALGVNLYSDKEAPSGFWLLEKHPEYDIRRPGSYHFVLDGVTLRKYTGLQVNKDPGAWMVWLGSLLLVAGIMIAFFVAHKRLWIKLQRGAKGGTEVTVGGMANKNRAAFAMEVNDLIKILKDIS